VNPAGDADARPVARLKLRRVSLQVPRERAPVFHVFEELYERARQGAAPRQGAHRDANGAAS